MIRLRRFKLRRRVRSLFWLILCRKNRQCFRYRRIGDPTRGKPRSICKLFTHLKSMAKTLYQGRISDREFKPSLEDRHVEVPKGKTAVYVGSEDGGDFHRYLVPVVYFNHPLFGQLLKAAEEEFGYDHQGGITIPCPTTEFERVRTRIAAGCGGRKMMTWKKGT